MNTKYIYVFQYFLYNAVIIYANSETFTFLTHYYELKSFASIGTFENK
jgi:hypothetical protein